MKVSPEILSILGRAETDGRRLVLAGPRMDARLYGRVDEVLRAIGGVWTSREGAHVFPGDAAATIAELKRTGVCTTERETVQTQQYFPTPPAVVERLLDLAVLRPGMEVLEPSAGRGALVAALVARGCKVDAVEQEEAHARVLAATGSFRALAVADFLAVGPRSVYDRVVMNPPFARDADTAHVTHALGFLRPGGLLVSVMPTSVAYRRSAAAFRDLVAGRGGSVTALPEGSFKKSGTGVDTVIVTVPAVRPEGPVPPPAWSAPQVPVPPSVADAGEEMQHPAVIARQIEADLRKAMEHIGAVARDLEDIGRP